MNKQIEPSKYHLSSDNSAQDPDYEPSSESESTIAKNSMVSEFEVDDDIIIAFDGGSSRDIPL